MDVTHLDSRRNKILEYIIVTHLETAAPVGSHEVCRRYHLRVSPATVRNIMGELERERLLTHPHTSAGRIPTTQGYRYYVDALMTPQTLTEFERRTIETLAHGPGDDPLELLRKASHLVAELTGQASVVLAPQMIQSRLRRIDLIPVDPRRILGVLMTADGLLKHAYLEWDELVDAAELARLSRFLNEELSGWALADVETRLQQALMDASSAFNHLYKQAQTLWALGAFTGTEATVFVDGISHLLAQPEFRDAQDSQRLLELIEAHDLLGSLLIETMAHGRRRMVIGVEHPHQAMTRCGVVSAPYRIRDRAAGALGVIGPARLEYPRVTAVVDAAAETVSRAMERFAA